MAETQETAVTGATWATDVPAKLTASVIGRIAREFGLQIAASLEDTRQVGGGKLAELGKQPQNVRVDLHETERGVAITLRDEEGVVLECQPDDPVEDTVGGAGATEGGGVRDQGEGGGSRTGSTSPDCEKELEAEVSRLEDENAGLSREVSALHVAVEEEKRRYKTLWRERCGQLADYDVVFEEKEAELMMLRARIAELERASAHSPVHSVHDDSLTQYTLR